MSAQGKSKQPAVFISSIGRICSFNTLEYLSIVTKDNRLLVDLLYLL